jgi:hypothetical protein
MKNTKGNRAYAAKRAMLNLAEEGNDHESREGLFLYAGVLEGLDSVAGFLSSQKIDAEIEDAKNSVHGFATEYALEMAK